MKQINRTILFVDDEANILDALRRQLRRKFEITTANSGLEGLQVIREQGPFAVVVTDYNMPGMDGLEFLKQVRQINPETVTAMLTGRAELEIAVCALHEGQVFRFLNKPCPREILIKAVEDCLEQYRLITTERMLTEELNQANEKLRALNQNLEHRVQERTATIRRLYRMVSSLNSLDNMEEIAELIVTTTADMLQSRRVSLMLPDHQHEFLSIIASVGIPREIAKQVRVPIGSPIAGQAFAQSDCIIVNDKSELPTANNQRYDTDLFASVPLISLAVDSSDGPIGVLNVTEQIDNKGYDTDSLASLKAICETAAIALMNQIRREERNEARDATILALAKLAEHRDPETGAHLERVQIYCRLLSEYLAQTPKYAETIDKNFIETIVRSSPLHDIGKVGVPDHILLKTGKLTTEEFEIMKKHAVIGGDTISALIKEGRNQSFLQMGRDIAYYHHEKYNGKGYPFGLEGENIPLPARIAAVADVYDALTTKRVYKKAFSHEKARTIIHEERGIHFDPDIVDAFNACEEEFKQLAAELADSVEPKVGTPATESERNNLELAASG